MDLNCKMISCVIVYSSLESFDFQQQNLVHPSCMERISVFEMRSNIPQVFG